MRQAAFWATLGCVVASWFTGENRMGLRVILTIARQHCGAPPTDLRPRREPIDHAPWVPVASRMIVDGFSPDSSITPPVYAAGTERKSGRGPILPGNGTAAPNGRNSPWASCSRSSSPSGPASRR